MGTSPFKRLIISGAVLLILGLIGAITFTQWWSDWAPPRKDYPIQGISVSATQEPIAWRSVHAQDVDFAYIAVTDGFSHRDTGFASNWEEAQKAGLRYGARLDYDLCRSPVDQATLFITTVPRDNGALPPAVSLDFHEGCETRPPRDVILSDLNTLLNLIEGHAGKPALLRVSKAFDALYMVDEGINRTLWEEGSYFPPSYGSRPWVMWTASHGRKIEGIDTPVEWVVVAK
jgi:lysozyme